MKVDKSGITDDIKPQAQRLLNQMKIGTRVFGNPAEGLRMTLKELDKKRSERKNDPLDFSVDDGDIKADIAKVKAGIDGEVALAEYIQKLIRLDEDLDGLLVFASLSDATQENDKDYIPDTDFIAVYGNHILVLDAKNIRTHPENPVFIKDGSLKNMNSVLIEEITPSTSFWKSYFKKRNVRIGSIDGYMVIYNKVGATILKNADWHKSGSKPIHVGDLRDTLKEWIKDKDGTASLRILTELSISQIKKPKSDIDLDAAFKKFGL